MSPKKIKLVVEVHFVVGIVSEEDIQNAIDYRVEDFTDGLRDDCPGAVFNVDITQGKLNEKENANVTQKKA